uniref:Methyltransferase n=1 Tax=Chromera velia CCMP2878 TaxID=1169474 RepID=A0A0G4HA75_9ALVE|mmetsp:Transcript_5945/g.11802  ORF Transcript_5945/g.11802 Transcript_5945/m.11802 type:complete len:406 (-) Transcript_5945:855-2072(-)|eukprot:Cvel_25646.t1-p1 / transcript=Cvel_25646.t1 / gene=Cvel_25646 / organism=Chromera_velia_CCMP2878 / gene_product=Cycloartenol-C-24-methyltransferase, putative / transcript_product=Cycloartenol-C-24-methyltransferase, putative / location=Cvel_scaffold2934:3429-5012(-) / protein_length=405 / sequence_SO=supercontig / SO=protein_coding / is_pseudo=false
MASKTRYNSNKAMGFGCASIFFLIIALLTQFYAPAFRGTWGGTFSYFGCVLLTFYFIASAVSARYNLGNVGNKETRSKIERYNKLYTEKSKEGTAEERKAVAAEMTNDYYDLATDFYQYGWGNMFHFAPRFKGEPFHESLRRHEYWLAHRGGMTKGQKWLDLGCGVGGPMRNIARFSEAHVTGINVCQYQIEKTTALNRAEGLDHLTACVNCDFMKLTEKLTPGGYDGAYAIEATCHASDRVKCFSEVFKCLKPGGVFVVYDWVMTDKYDAKNPEHVRVKRGIEAGDSLPDLVRQEDVVAAFKKAGFQVEEHFDRCKESQQNVRENPVPWYSTIAPGWSPENWKSSVVGRTITHCMVTVLEAVGLAPQGTVATHTMLCGALEPLSTGGITGIFTPAYYVKGRKPL